MHHALRDEWCLLDKAISIALRTVASSFAKFALDINWKRGKSECFVKYRGKHATTHYANNRVDGAIVYNVPAVPGLSSETTLHAVDCYTHLGFVSAMSGKLALDARHKERNAMGAYAPLAINIFGNRDLDIGLRDSLGTSLVLSRLLFNIQVVALDSQYVRVLGSVYMRLQRRLYGEVRFAAGAKSDLEVRSKHSVPSIDCVLMRRRLLYLRRILAHKPRTLEALLHLQPRGSRLRWVQLVSSDLAWVRTRILTHLPAADLAISEWVDAISHVSWRQVVQAVFFVDSINDATCHASACTAEFSCDVCQGKPRFATARALKSHMRAKHGHRNRIRLFIFSGTCPVCATEFVDRLRCIAHLSDLRRPKCRDTLLSGSFPTVPLVRLAELDLHDRALRHSAWKCGRSHHIAVGPATSSSGRTVGRAVSAGY